MVMIRSKYTSEDFDHFVRVLIGRWEDAIEWQADWASFDGEQRAALTEDWPVNNGILMDLEAYIRSHDLTEDQETQWRKLYQLVTEHTKDLEEMGYRVRVPKTVKGKAAA
jgi:hypothetical protein